MTSVVALFDFLGAIMIVSFCGHSSYVESKEDEKKIIDFLERKAGNAPLSLYLGGYGAFDEFARRCGKKYQATHPNTELIFITPYMTLEYQKNHLEHLGGLYDDIIYPELESVPLRFAISYRNKWMVEKSDCVISYIKHTSGGAYQTYRFAKRKKKEIFNITGLNF